MSDAGRKPLPQPLRHAAAPAPLSVRSANPTSRRTRARRRLYEYATVAVQAAPENSVFIQPVNEETESIAAEATNRGLCWTLNQLADLGYRLLPGSRLEAWNSSYDGLIVMEREKER